MLLRFPFVLALLALFHTVPLHSQTFSRLRDAITNLDRQEMMLPASWSLTVMDAKTGQVLVSHDPHRVLASASVMKVLTTATALAVLGPEFHYRTLLEYDGELRGGVLYGSIYIRGDGDPSLGSDRLGNGQALDVLMSRWAEQIQAAGIREVRGNIIGDASIFNTQMTPPKWSWEDMGNYYGAGAVGLNIHENQYTLNLKPGPREGSPTSVLGTDPEIPVLVFANELMTGAVGSGDKAYIFGAPYTHIRYLRGTIPAGKSSFSIKGSIPDPSLYCAWRLALALIERGVRVDGTAESQRRLVMAGNAARKPRKMLFVHEGPSLAEIVKLCNRYSINLYAEALARRTAVALGMNDRPGQAADALEGYWSGRGLDTRGMRLRDGSGLSPNNLLSSHQLASILVKARKSSYGDVLLRSLPVAGRSGTLKSRMRGSAAEGRLHAKTGSTSGVRSYAGYVTTRGGRDLAFALISNAYEGSASAMRRQLERILVAMAEGE